MQKLNIIIIIIEKIILAMYNE